MEWFTAIDIYCERLDPSFWAEPFNALSNVAFIIASLWAWVAANRLGKCDNTIKLLCILVGCIGVGSFLFHVYANMWSSLADVIPIWSFVGLYVVVSVIRLTGKPPLRVGGIASGVVAVIVGLVWILSIGSATQEETSPDVFNGSLQYAPAFIALWVFALITMIKGFACRIWIVSAACLFTAALVLRTVDMHLCTAFPTGTHFLWHIFNGAMVAFLLQGLIRIDVKAQ